MNPGALLDILIITAFPAHLCILVPLVPSHRPLFLSFLRHELLTSLPRLFSPVHRICPRTPGRDAGILLALEGPQRLNSCPWLLGDPREGASPGCSPRLLQLGNGHRVPDTEQAGRP